MLTAMVSWIVTSASPISTQRFDEICSLNQHHRPIAHSKGPSRIVEAHCFCRQPAAGSWLPILLITYRGKDVRWPFGIRLHLLLQEVHTHDDARTANRTVGTHLFGASEAVQEGLDGAHLQSWLAFWPPLPRGLVPRCAGAPYRVTPAWEPRKVKLLRRLFEMVRSMMAPHLMHFQA
jgi:hypothetical protein